MNTVSMKKVLEERGSLFGTFCECIWVNNDAHIVVSKTSGNWIQAYMRGFVYITDAIQILLGINKYTFPLI